MNGQVFIEWVKDQLLPSLPAKSVLVLDNAPYHNVRTDDSVCPTSNWRKIDMMEWLDNRDIEYPLKIRKPELYEIVKANKIEPKYKGDELLRDSNHEVSRLPAYHCTLNPIELIWADMKNQVGLDNTSFKVPDVERLIHENFERIDANRWKNCVQHVISKVESRYWKADGLQEIEPVIINLDSSDESSDDDDDDSWQRDSDSDQE